MENNKNAEEVKDIKVGAEKTAITKNAKVEPVKGFFSRLMSGVIDQCVVVGSSLIALLIIDLAVKPFGYAVIERIPLFFILYVVANILYPTILLGTKIRTTLGNKLFK